jgi:tetrahydromethanopterin S-methyltransferase subunit F
VIMNKLDSYIQKHRWTGLMAGIVIALVVATILKMIMELTRPVFF